MRLPSEPGNAELDEVVVLIWVRCSYAALSRPSAAEAAAIVVGGCSFPPVASR